MCVLFVCSFTPAFWWSLISLSLSLSLKSQSWMQCALKSEKSAIQGSSPFKRRSALKRIYGGNLKILVFLICIFLSFLVHNVVCTYTQCLLYICTHFYGRLNSSGLMTLEFLPEDHISHLVFLITTQMSLFKQQKLFVTTRLRLYELHIWPNYVVDIFSRVLLLSNVGYVHSFAFG